MITLATELRKSFTNKEGKHPVYLRLGKDRKKKYISLGLFAKKEEWNEEYGLFKKDKRINPNYEKDNNFINSQLAKAKEIVEDFEKKKIDFTFNQYQNAFDGYLKKGNVKEFFDNQINDLEETGRVGNANCYKRTLEMLMLFDKKFKDRVFSEIDYKYIVRFDNFLQKPRTTIYTYKSGNKKEYERKGCSGNTRRYYLKTFRAVLNKAIKEDEASIETYPFGENGFDLGKLEEETIKRYLPTNYLDIIKNYTSNNRTYEFGRKLFLFSYYCYGMSFVDMALLNKNENVKLLEDGYYIVYKRHKLKQNKKTKFIYIKITPLIQELIDDLNKFQPAVGNYMLPIITGLKPTERKKYEHIHNMLKKFNGYLKKLGDEAGIEGIKMTSYVSRHTMAMSLQNNSIDTKMISQMMGHNKLETTITYLDSFANQEINKAACVL